MNEAKEIRAFHNICTHRAASVATGEGSVPVATPGALRLECPYHGWQFDLNGRFRGCKIAHGLAGIENFSPESSGLTPIPSTVWGPLVFLNWGNTPLEPIEAFLGAGGAQLASEGVTSPDWVHHKKVDYPMACNWKCMTDNYLDGNYHLFTCHPGLIGCFKMLDNKNLLFDNVAMLCGPNEAASDWPEEGQPGGPLHHQMVTRTRGGKDQSYSNLYPNTFINRYGEVRGPLCWR